MLSGPRDVFGESGHSGYSNDSKALYTPVQQAFYQDEKGNLKGVVGNDLTSPLVRVKKGEGSGEFWRDGMGINGRAPSGPNGSGKNGAKGGKDGGIYLETQHGMLHSTSLLDLNTKSMGIITDFYGNLGENNFESRNLNNNHNQINEQEYRSKMLSNSTSFISPQMAISKARPFHTVGISQSKPKAPMPGFGSLHTAKILPIQEDDGDFESSLNTNHKNTNYRQNKNLQNDNIENNFISLKNENNQDKFRTTPHILPQTKQTSSSSSVFIPANNQKPSPPITTPKLTTSPAAGTTKSPQARKTDSKDDELISSALPPSNNSLNRSPNQLNQPNYPPINPSLNRREKRSSSMLSPFEHVEPKLLALLHQHEYTAENTSFDGQSYPHSLDPHPYDRRNSPSESLSAELVRSEKDMYSHQDGNQQPLNPGHDGLGNLRGLALFSNHLLGGSDGGDDGENDTNVVSSHNMNNSQDKIAGFASSFAANTELTELFGTPEGSVQSPIDKNNVVHDGDEVSHQQPPLSPLPVFQQSASSVSTSVKYNDAANQGDIGANDRNNNIKKRKNNNDGKHKTKLTNDQSLQTGANPDVNHTNSPHSPTLGNRNLSDTMF